MKRWRKLALWIFFGLVFTAGVVFILDYYGTKFAGHRRFTRAVEALDAAEPGWRINDLVSTHNAKVHADNQNLATQLFAATPTFNEGDDRIRTLLDQVAQANSDYEINERRTPGVEAAYAELLATYRGDIDALHRIAQQAAGPCFSITLDLRKVSDTLLRHLDRVSQAEYLLDSEIEDALARNDPRCAVRGILTLGGLVRMLGDEPFVSSQGVRRHLLLLMNGRAERLLGLTTPADAALAVLQNAIAKERAVPRLTTTIRGDRAYAVATLDDFDAGIMTLHNFTTCTYSKPDDLDDEAVAVYLRQHVPRAKAELLDAYADLLAITTLPLPARPTALAAAKAKWPVKGPFRNAMFYLAVEDVDRAFQLEASLQAQTAAGLAGIACERYRLKFGHWPESLSEIPDLLRAAPLEDPNTGGPFAYTRTETGVVITVVLPATTSSPTPRPYEFKLFDPAHRRLPAKPKPPADGEEPK
jgi:hypothetical protein